MTGADLPVLGDPAQVGCARLASMSSGRVKRAVPPLTAKPFSSTLRPLSARSTARPSRR
ncbi:hypothetical protein [Solihabitans fulvus]|uniref:hypothetical protein n=1 Tax=Solihabitans fulvus TaxID=1892852 RepID=UPI001661D0C7|nr:hypothetical protein [Solihabitans fulvus]